MRTMLLGGLVSLAVVLAGCASAPEENVTEQSEGLRVLESNEIVGTIAYGQTKRVNYSPTPRYRALSFQASKGDQISVSVRGIANADPLAFLLASDYSTLVRNDNETTSTRNAKITYTTQKAGKYFIAVREMDEETSPTSQFDVELSKTNAPPPPPPPPPSSKDPYNPASCAGTPLSQAAIVALFPSGTVGKKLFKGTKSARIRTCTELGGCAPWRESKDVYPKFRWSECNNGKRCEADKTSLSIEFQNSVSTPTLVGLDLATSEVTFKTDQGQASANYDGNGKVSIANLWGAGNGKGLNMYLAIEGSNQLGMAFDIDVRSTCFRAVTKYNNDSPSAQQHTEAELVIMGDITP